MNQNLIHISDIQGNRVLLTPKQNDFLNELKSKCPVTRTDGSQVYCINVYLRRYTEYPNECLVDGSSLLATSCDFNLTEQKKWIREGLKYDFCVNFMDCTSRNIVHYDFEY